LTLGLALYFSFSCCCGLFIDEVFVFFFHSLTRSSSRRSGTLSRILLLLHTRRHSLTHSSRSLTSILHVDRRYRHRHVPSIVSIGMQPIPSLSPSASVVADCFFVNTFIGTAADPPLIVSGNDPSYRQQPTLLRSLYFAESIFHPSYSTWHDPSIGTQPIYLRIVRRHTSTLHGLSVTRHHVTLFDTAAVDFRHCHSGDYF